MEEHGILLRQVVYQSRVSLDYHQRILLSEELEEEVQEDFATSFTILSQLTRALSRSQVVQVDSMVRMLLLQVVAVVQRHTQQVQTARQVQERILAQVRLEYH